jgi:peptidyl-dipeptidase Dcp
MREEPAPRKGKTMKNVILFGLVVLLVSWSCATPSEEPVAESVQNPFFSEWDTPFGVPPFDQITEEHYKPAFEEGMKKQRAEIDAIVGNEESPTFENTVEALERSGALLTKVNYVFGNRRGALTNETIQAIDKEMAPVLSKHRDDILLNADLFERVKAVYERKEELDLTPEQGRLLEDQYKDFVRGGANLDEEKKSELRKINEELSVLSVKFGENVLKETNKFEMVIENEADLAGLPDTAVAGAAEAASERGHEGKWVFTIHKPSMVPFLQYSEMRELREKIFKAYINKGNNDDELDNKKIASRMAALRVKKAALLGYETHAHFVLEEYMAKVPENVYDLLNQLWKPALAMAKKEAAMMQEMIDEEGGDFKLAPWDWWYYAEKIRKVKYQLDEEAIRPYFKVENVIDGAFMVANKLWGITFEERQDIPKYHEDVTVFGVKEADGSHIGVLYTDYFPRASKRGGAWKSNFRKQHKLDGENITPVIYNVGNFSKPTADKPALISFEEAATLFHEFGHALHGLLSDCTYASLSGTSVPRDFVELPSQIMENWAAAPEVLKMYAKHYETGEPIPDELVKKIKDASKFNQGFITVEYLAASFLDMDWHTLKDAEEKDTLAFENESLGRIGLIPEIIVRYRSPYFAHVFSGGYSSGYYSYIWAEVLDSDAFQAFKETSLFDQETATSYRKNILATGGTEDPMVLYKRFRGREPKIEPLLEKRGLN